VIGKPIVVGKGPLGIGVNKDTNTIYVANSGNNTVSVIDGRTNTVIGKAIPVGNGPDSIGVNPYANATYFGNGGDNTVSVIDGEVNKVVARVMFNIKPFYSGYVVCNNTTDNGNWTAPLQQQFYVYAGSECTALPEPGFEFDSWREDLGHNSTQLISLAPPPSIVDSIENFFHISHDIPQSRLNITKFGTFTADFKAPPPPDVYVVTLFTVVATALIGLGTFIGSTVIRRIKASSQVNKLEYYYNEIKNAYNDSKIDGSELNNLSGSIKDEYARGNINKESYDRLKDEISLSFGEILRKEIDSLKNLFYLENDKVKRLCKIVSDIKEMHLKGKINNDYYTNLKQETSILYEEVFNKRIKSLDGLSENEKGKLLVKIKDDITDAYSKERISESHYNLLEKKLSNYEKPKT
jgi:YVTN family beta-propeller protein